MRRLPILAAAAALLALHGAQAAAGGVMRQSEVTESALIEALAPAAQAGTEEPARLGRPRSLRIDRVEDSTRLAVQAPVDRHSASILITFKTSSSALTPEARQALDKIASALNSDRLASLRFVIEGHADPRGDPQANQRLSQERADAVRQYLLARHQIAEQRLDSVGKGDRELLNPAVPAAPENRRITFVTMTP